MFDFTVAGRISRQSKVSIAMLERLGSIGAGKAFEFLPDGETVSTLKKKVCYKNRTFGLTRSKKQSTIKASIAMWEGLGLPGRWKKQSTPKVHEAKERFFERDPCQIHSSWVWIWIAHRFRGTWKKTVDNWKATLVDLFGLAANLLFADQATVQSDLVTVTCKHEQNQTDDLIQAANLLLARDQATVQSTGVTSNTSRPNSGFPCF